MSVEDSAAAERLREIIREKSFGEGVQITLASGRVSNFYFNMKPAMLDPEGAALFASMACGALEDAGANMIGGLEIGAVPIVAFVAAESFRCNRPIPAFFVRKQIKEHGAQKLIEGLAPGESLAGRRICIVEDVTTTGGSALKAVDLVKSEGAEVVLLLTLMDRQEGAAETFAKAGIPFKALFRAEEFLSR